MLYKRCRDLQIMEHLDILQPATSQLKLARRLSALIPIFKLDWTDNAIELSRDPVMA
jgi:hypothetical protein